MSPCSYYGVSRVNSASVPKTGWNVYCQTTTAFQIYDELPLDYCGAGCTEPTAQNYEAAATIEDGSCTYSCTTLTVSRACNYGDTNGTLFTAVSPT